MNSWQAAEWLAAAAILVAVIFGILTIRGAQKRRGKLLVAHTSTSLLAEGAGARLLEVTFRDITVPDPHLITIFIKNIGPYDLTSEHFHEKEPLKITVQGTWYGVVEQGRSTGGKLKICTEGIGADNAVVRFLPDHIPKGEELVVKFIVSGPSSPVVTGALVNVDIIEGETTSSAVLRALGRAALGAYIPLFVVLGEVLGNASGSFSTDSKRK